LSFPGLYQNIRRAQTIKVQAYDLKGRLIERVVSDIESRAWQHEIDHLNGVLFIDMMGPIAKFAARSSVKQFEKVFREAQKRGEIPPDVEIEKLIAALKGEPVG
jgi:peptide deformylase